ncbi:MAG TPA: tyrosine-type recombinase/integrase, partial [Terriglobales bacterium]|nr:tyrosine-type recombinase/integrase [Terriglobales bacterium]
MKHLHLQIHADRYAELRQALGFKFRERGLVQQFVDFLEAQNCSGPIRTALALEWAVSASPSCGRCGQVRRLTVAWHFLIYLKAFLPDTEIPASGLLTEERRPRPYLYSSEEIVGMQQATRTLWEPGCLKQITFETLIGLLASTGLRIGEIASLRRRHIQIGATSFLEIHGKGRKERNVPIWHRTARTLKTWLETCAPSAESPAFPNARGGPLSRDGVNYILKAAARSAANASPSLSGKRISPHVI